MGTVGALDGPVRAFAMSSGRARSAASWGRGDGAVDGQFDGAKAIKKWRCAVEGGMDEGGGSEARAVALRIFPI